MSERRVVDHDVLGRDALLFEIGFKDLVGRARIDVVSASEHPALHLLVVHQVIDGGDRLLVGRGAGIEHIALAFLAFVLHRIEQNRVQFLEHRQHGFARHGGPAAEHDRDLVLADQFARLFGEQRPVRGRVDDHRLELLAEHATLLVLLVDEHQHHVFQRGLADRHGAGEGVQNADLDGVLSACRRRRQADGKTGRGPEPAPMQRSFTDRTRKYVHWSSSEIDA